MIGTQERRPTLQSWAPQQNGTTPTVYSNPPTTRDRSAGGPLDRWEWARDFGTIHDLSSTNSHLLNELAYRADAAGKCWPSWANLQSVTRLSRQSIWRGLRQLSEAGALVVEVSGEVSRSSNTYRLTGASTSWIVTPCYPPSNTLLPPPFQGVTPLVTESYPEPYSEPSNEPSIEPSRLQAKEIDDAIPTPEELLIVEEPEPSESTQTTATPSRLTAQPVKTSKPRKHTPKVKQAPSVSPSFTAEMVEKYPGTDVPTEINAALNHKAAQNYYPDHEPYVRNWLRRSAEWAKERNGKPRSTRPQIKADWQEYDFFGESSESAPQG